VELGVVFEHWGKSELGQRRLVFLAEIDGDAAVGVVARVPEDAHGHGGWALAPFEVHETGRYIGAGRSRDRQTRDRTQDGGARTKPVVESFHRVPQSQAKSAPSQVCGTPKGPASARSRRVRAWARRPHAHAFRLNNVERACYLLTVPDFLLELFSEEIPARMQARAAEDLRKLVTE